MTSVRYREFATRPLDIDVLDGRHVVENALAQYCSAMDSQDAASAGRLLANADLFFKDQPRRRGREDIEAFYKSVFGSVAGGTAHLVSNVRVGVENGTIFYSCLYQRALLDATGAPTLSGIGSYAGRFTRLDGTVSWLEHHVTAL